MLASTSDGGWVSYVFNNPDIGDLQSKHSWVVRHDGLIFGSGWYTADASYTEFFVKSAIGKYNVEGLDATLEYYNSPESVNGQWYLVTISN